MNDKESLYLMGNIILLSNRAFRMATEAHDHVFGEDKCKPDTVIALSYCNQACATMNCARAIYLLNRTNIEHTDIEDFFHQFDVFTKELITNYATDHSNQWTDIEYQKLKNIFEHSALNQSARPYLEPED